MSLFVLCECECSLWPKVVNPKPVMLTLSCVHFLLLVFLQGTTGYPASGSSASTGYNTRGQYNPYANTAAATQPAAAGTGAAGAAAATTSYDDAAAAYGQYKDTTGYGQYYNQQQYQQYGQYPQQGYGQQYGQGR